jgi:hypothetical protein
MHCQIDFCQNPLTDNNRIRCMSGKSKDEWLLKTNYFLKLHFSIQYINLHHRIDRMRHFSCIEYMRHNH